MPLGRAPTHTSGQCARVALLLWFSCEGLYEVEDPQEGCERELHGLVYEGL